MGLCKFCSNVFSHACGLLCSKRNTTKTARKLQNIRVSNMLLNCLLVLSLVCNDSLSASCDFGIPLEDTRLYTLYTNNSVIINNGGQEVAKCYPTDYATNSTADKHLLCLGRANIMDGLFSDEQTFYAPEHLFPDGSEKDVLKCKVFRNGICNTMEYAFFKCQPSSDKTPLSHALYHASNLVNNISTSIYESLEGNFSCFKSGEEYLCKNLLIQRHFLPKGQNIKEKTLVAEVAQRIEAELQYIENEDGTVKPWPFDTTLLVRDEDNKAYICTLDESKSNIFEARYTCVDSKLSSAILKILRSTGSVPFLALSVLPGIASAIYLWWHERKITQKTADIIHKHCKKQP